MEEFEHSGKKLHFGYFERKLCLGTNGGYSATLYARTLLPPLLRATGGERRFASGETCVILEEGLCWSVFLRPMARKFL